MKRSILSLFCAAIAGCGPSAPEDATGTTVTTGAADPSGTTATTVHEPGITTVHEPGVTTGGAPTTTPTTDASSTTGVATTASTTTDVDPDPCGTCNFLCDGCGTTGSPFACDPFAQDCPEGEKCSPVASSKSSAFDATLCVPISGDGAAGEACTVEGDGLSGLDDCRKGATCWYVDAEHHGTCVDLCGGTPDRPTCDDAAFACVSFSAAASICFQRCDPLAQNCQGSDLCIARSDTFVCTLAGPGELGQVFDPCEFLNVCDKGLYCLPPQYAMECDPNAGGCCLPFCDLSDMNATCPGVSQSCMPWFEEGLAPPEYMNVGICIIPE